MATKFLDKTGLGYFWGKIKAWCNTTFAVITHSHAWSTITGKPTTVSGYGITDAKINNGTITLGSNSITPLTSHQNLDGKMTRGSYERIEGTDSTHKDLNDYTTAGFYNVKTQYVDNCPTGIDIDAVLLVYPWNFGSYCTQEITESATSGDTRRWIRKLNSLNGTTWSAWKEVAFINSNITGNAATATKLATARTISLSGAVTGSVNFDGSANSEISTVWRSCIVGHSDNNPNGQNWFKVATFTADASYLDYSITFYVEETYYNAHQGILKIHLRTNWDKILGTNREHDTYLTWLTHTNYPLSDFVLVCPTTASPTLELWTRIPGQYVGRRFVVLSEGNTARAVTQWSLVGSINVRESSITSTGTQVESSENTYYVNNSKQQDIAGFKTFWNDLTLRGANILKYDNTSFLLLSSGNGFSKENGAHINLYGAEYSSGAGSFVLYTGHATQTTCPALFGLPSGSLQWNGQSIQTSSDERLKTSLTTVADEILDIWENIQWGQFQFLDAVEEKGQNARLHLGFIAQHVKSVFEAHNIDICKFGILCHEIREATEFEPAFEQWMARYTEALCMEVIYQRRKNKILENRISELETQVQNMLQILESLKGA